MKKAKQTLRKEDGYFVQEDYTERVRLHRRELGKKLIEARENDQFAVMNFDKLIIENSVYRYNEGTKGIVRVGAVRGHSRAKGHLQTETMRGIQNGDRAQSTQDKHVESPRSGASNEGNELHGT